MSSLVTSLPVVALLHHNRGSSCLLQALFNFSHSHHSIYSLLPGGQPSATPLVDFGRQNGTSLTWTVNQPAGTSLGLTLRDSTGKVAQSAPFTVTASTSRKSHISSILLTNLLIRFLLISRHELPHHHHWHWHLQNCYWYHDYDRRNHPHHRPCDSRYDY